MCLGETRNNQGDRFVYDGKISKSKRKLFEGGINVFASSFLRAKHIPNIYRAKDIRTAEAAKVIENIQRDLNIALMNELSLIFDKMGLDTKAVLEAAGTKWNFHKYSPGLVGGHCIPVDP